MRLAIRDDDTCFFTRPDELERLWSPLFGTAGISLAVTPFAVQSFHLGDVKRFYQDTRPRPLEENRELVAWIRERQASGSISVMCHGCTHEYRRLGPGRLVEEYVWKGSDRLARETGLARDYLAGLLGRPIRTFVPPGNGISRAAIESVRPYFRQILAAFSLRRWRDFRFEPEYVRNYCARLYHQIRHNGANPFGERVAGVTLLPSFALTPGVTWNALLARFELCRRLAADLVVAVHYWEVSPGIRDLLLRLIDLARKAGCRFVHCDELFGSDKETHVHAF